MVDGFGDAAMTPNGTRLNRVDKASSTVGSPNTSVLFVVVVANKVEEEGCLRRGLSVGMDSVVVRVDARGAGREGGEGWGGRRETSSRERTCRWTAKSRLCRSSLLNLCPLPPSPQRPFADRKEGVDGRRESREGKGPGTSTRSWPSPSRACPRRPFPQSPGPQTTSPRQS